MWICECGYNARNLQEERQSKQTGKVISISTIDNHCGIVPFRLVHLAFRSYTTCDVTYKL